MTNKQILIRLGHSIYPYKNMLIIASIAMLFVAGCTGAQVYLLKNVIDDIFVAKNLFYLKLLPFLYIFIFLTKGIFYYIYSLLLEKVGQSVIRDFRNKLFQHIHTQSLSFFHDMPTGTLIARVISDVALIQQAVSNALIGILRDCFTVIILLCLVFFMNWKLAMFSFVILPIASYPIVRFGKIFRKLSTKTQEETAHVSNMLHETITGNRIVKAFCKEDYENSRFGKQIHTLYSITVKDASYRSLQHPLMEFIGGVAIAGYILFGGYDVIQGNTTTGTFFTLLTGLIAAYEPLKKVSRINSVIQQGLAAASRVFTILDTKPEITDADDATVLPSFKKKIEFRNLTFSYNGKDIVLSDINLEVSRGEALAIVGPSGGGKTTLTDLIPRFLEIQNGAILIDDLDIRKATLHSLRSQISMVTQNTILFNDTVKNNIAYGELNCTEEDIHNAAQAAHAMEFINELPKGFDTIIGEGGSRLSGGQRQRLSIARALLKNAPILILDEATSALDTKSEREVQKALENLMKNRTTFVIAHRLSTIKNADRIIVIKEGRIVEQGTHSSLLTQKGHYHTLHAMQTH